MDPWTFAEAYRHQPSAVPELIRAIADAGDDARAAILRDIQRSGGRKRPFDDGEMARWLLGLCVRCGQVRPTTSRGRYCGESCRRQRNLPTAGAVSRSEVKRRRDALRVGAREAVQQAMISWLTRRPGAWGEGDASGELRGLLDDLHGDLGRLAAAALRIPAEASVTEARKALADELSGRKG